MPDTTIESAKYNALVADLVEDANFPRPVAAGGIGSDTALGGFDNLSAGSVNIASATVTNLANATAVNVTVTGSTTIEEFGTIKAGVKRFLTFSGALTLTHHATKLILPGGANIATGAGDTCIAQSLGAGNWRITGYQRAAIPPAAAASETTKGVVEKATVAETRSAAADKYIAADLIETASVLVTLTDAATVPVDWATFINGEVTLTADRVLGNPTNGQPGTYRTILVKGDGATGWELTFGNQYLGQIPEVVAITDTTWYLLTIRCITTSHFIVSAHLALGSCFIPGMTGAVSATGALTPLMLTSVSRSSPGAIPPLIAPAGPLSRRPSQRKSPRRTTMRATRLRNGALIFAAALMLAACSTSRPAPVTSDGLRLVVGTSLIGARGKTSADQLKIDSTAAGLCGGGIWTRSECAQHGRESRQ